MKALVVYDSQFGNTEKVAQVIAKNLSAKLVPASRFQVTDLTGIKLLVVGSPTQGGRPTLPLQNALNSLPKKSLANIKVAAFDTSFDIDKQNFALKMLMKTIGYASTKILAQLESLGGKRLAEPEIFIVTGREGPLLAKELERAAAWAKDLLN